jgi:biopolymer transport protein ExbD
MRPRWRKRLERDPSGIDVTAFLSLMVILVPFLLMTAVFTRITALEVQPPSSAGDQAMPPDPLQLQVIVRKDAIEVRHLAQSQAERIEWSDDDATLRALANLASELKARHPESLTATVLVEPQIAYDLVVQVLDALRIEARRDGQVVTRAELFPLISLGPVSPTGPWMQGAR